MLEDVYIVVVVVVVVVVMFLKPKRNVGDFVEDGI